MKIYQLLGKYEASFTTFRGKLPDEREKSPISWNTGGNSFSLITFPMGQIKSNLNRKELQFDSSFQDYKKLKESSLHGEGIEFD